VESKSIYFKVSCRNADAQKPIGSPNGSRTPYIVSTMADTNHPLVRSRRRSGEGEREREKRGDRWRPPPVSSSSSLLQGARVRDFSLLASGRRRGPQGLCRVVLLRASDEPAISSLRRIQRRMDGPRRSPPSTRPETRLGIAARMKGSLVIGFFLWLRPFARRI
jgi:hypothetical protein